MPNFFLFLIMSNFIIYIESIREDQHMSPVYLKNITSDLRAVEPAATTVNVTTTAPIDSGPVSMTTLDPDTTFSDNPEYPSNFLSIFSSEMLFG